MSKTAEKVVTGLTTVSSTSQSRCAESRTAFHTFGWVPPECLDFSEIHDLNQNSEKLGLAEEEWNFLLWSRDHARTLGSKIQSFVIITPGTQKAWEGVVRLSEFLPFTVINLDSVLMLADASLDSI